jgi:SseB protein C-terminal domain
MWLRDLFRPAPEIRTERRVTFLREQDGPPERELKEALARDFAASGRVVRAYLVQVDFPRDGSNGVALCVRAPEADEAAVVRQVAAPFAAMFATEVPLDVMFVSPRQELELQKVCAPFYSRAP